MINSYILFLTLVSFNGGVALDNVRDLTLENCNRIGTEWKASHSKYSSYQCIQKFSEIK